MERTPLPETGHGYSAREYADCDGKRYEIPDVYSLDQIIIACIHYDARNYSEPHGVIFGIGRVRVPFHELVKI